MLFIRTVNKDDSVTWSFNYQLLNDIFAAVTKPIRVLWNFLFDDAGAFLFGLTVFGAIVLIVITAVSGQTEHKRETTRAFFVNSKLGTVAISPLTAMPWYISGATSPYNATIDKFLPTAAPCTNAAVNKALTDVGVRYPYLGKIDWATNSHEGPNVTCWGIVVGTTNIALAYTPTDKPYSGDVDDAIPAFTQTFSRDDLSLQ